MGYDTKFTNSIKHLVLLFFFLWVQNLIAQEKKILIKGKVHDIGNMPIAHAAIQNIETNEGTTADVLGNYYLKAVLPTTIKVVLLGYKTVLKRIPSIQHKDTVEEDFTLETDSELLKRITIISAPAAQPDLLKESGSLMDFEIHNNKIWLLYHYRKDDVMELYDSTMNYLSRISLNHRAEALNKEDNTALYLSQTPTNSLFDENTDSIYFYEYNPIRNTIDEIGMSREQFDKATKNLCAYHYPYYYWFLQNFDNSSINYVYFKSLVPDNKLLYDYSDISMARHNDPVLLELHGINQPENCLDFMSRNASQVDAAALSLREETLLELLVRNIYCPLKIVRDSIYIFNFDNDSILVFNLENEKRRQFSLSFQIHGMEIHYPEIMVDDEGMNCYYKYVYNDQVYIENIDLNSGIEENKQKLEFPFPNKIRIMGGYVYYTVTSSTPNDMTIEQLFREKLKN